MRKSWLVIFLALCIPMPSPGQDVGTAVDTSDFSLALSYEHLSRDFELAGIRQEVHRDIYRATLGLKPWEWIFLYGFAGTSNFPNSYVPEGKTSYFGGGLKFMMVGEVDVQEEEGRALLIRCGIGLDLQISRLQSSHSDDYEHLGITRYQGSLDFGLRIWQVAGYLGIKFSRTSGSLQPVHFEQDLDAEGKGLFSMMLGFNLHLGRRFAVVSEFSFFTELAWSLGLRVEL